MVNKIWGFFIVIGILCCFINGKMDIVNAEILNSTKTSLDMILQIFPVMALWLGIMKIATKSGLLAKMANKLSFFLKRLFKEIPEGHESLGYIASNMICNFFGLGNAATPFGLKAMQSLQELNEQKDTASKSMITFLVLNTSGITLIPTTIISLRMLYHSANATEIVFPCFLATFLAASIGLCFHFVISKRRTR